MKNLIILLSTILVFASCTKQNAAPQTQTSTFGSITDSTKFDVATSDSLYIDTTLTSNAGSITESQSQYANNGYVLIAMWSSNTVASYWQVYVNGEWTTIESNKPSAVYITTETTLIFRILIAEKNAEGNITYNWLIAK